MAKKPDDDLQLDGFDDEAPATGAPWPAPTVKASPGWGPPSPLIVAPSAKAKTDADPPSSAFVPLRRKRPDEDDLDNKGSSRLRRSGSAVGEFVSERKKILLIALAIAGAVTGVFYGGGRLLRSHSGTDSSGSEADHGPTDLELGIQQRQFRTRVLIKKDGEDYQCPPGTDRYASTIQIPAPRTWQSSKNAGTEPQQGLRGNDPYELECAAPSGKKLSIRCTFNFTPPNQFTAICDGVRESFDGDPVLQFIE